MSLDLTGVHEERTTEYADYLGDGVYVDYDGLHVTLMANGVGSQATDTILLEGNVIEALLRYLKRIGVSNG